MFKTIIFGALCAFAVASTTPALAGGYGGSGGKYRILLKHVAPGNGKYVFVKPMPEPAVRAHLRNHPRDRKIRSRKR